MGLPTPGTNKLQVLRAIEDGWQAFCRAPWPFLLFEVLGLVVGAPFPPADDPKLPHFVRPLGLGG